MVRALGWTLMLSLSLAPLPAAAQPSPDLRPERLREIRAEAEAGSAGAQLMMGRIYDNGAGGVAADKAEAVRWYRRSAEAGYAQAQTTLGFAILEGRGGLARDPAEAARWFLRAAEQDVHYAQWELGDIYAAGRGVAKDPAEACFWLGLAARAGVEEKGFRERVASALTPGEIAAVERRIESWLAVHPEEEEEATEP